MPVPVVTSAVASVLKKHGLPTAVAIGLLLSLLWVVERIVDGVGSDVRALSEEVDHLARIVDLSCQPAKPPPRGDVEP